MKPFLNTLFILSGLFGVTTHAQQGARAVPGEYLIKFKVSSGGAAAAQMKLQGKASFKGSFPGLGILQISMKQGADMKANYESLKNDPDVEYIEPNYILEKSEVEPNEPVEKLSYDQAVSLGVQTDPASYAQSSALTGVADAWPLLKQSASANDKVVVAVVDTGLDAYHDVFKPYQTNGSGGTGALWVNQVEANGIPGVDDDQNGYVDDKNGWNFITNTNNFADDDNHGTHVAGIVVGTGQNIFSRPLVESKILIMPLKFLGTDGGSTSNAIRAIYYAVNNGARVINNSWGGSGFSRALLDALTYAYDHHVLVVSAAGNFSSNNDVTPIYPANYSVPSNLSVGSTSRYDSLSSFSNYGATTVNIGSPGEFIESTIPNNLIMKMSGTSMATPFVAGMAALAFREAPNLSGYQMKQIIMDTVLQNNYLQNRVTTAGRIDALALIQIAQTMVTASSAQPAYKPQYLSEDRAPASEGAGAAGCGLVKAVTKNGPGSGNGSGAPGPVAAVVIGLLLAPLALWQALRLREPKNKRRYDRFKMSSEVRVTVGDRELIGAINTISQGGVSFNTDAALEKGGIVTMRIQSPDGREAIEVQGQVVWSESSQSYGVQFSNAKQGTLAMIRDWTAGLMKT